MNKVIFLDIDGVLNTWGDFNLINDIFEKTKLELVIELSKITNSNIVITTDRRIYPQERIKIDDTFDLYNIPISYMSYKITKRKRADEIIEYLENNPVDRYIILDDNDFGYTQNNILNKYFLDTYENGLTKDIVNEAIKILNGE